MPALRLNFVAGLLLAAAASGQSLPESPALVPDVVSTSGDRPVHGHVSARRSTHDGRVRVKGSSDATARSSSTGI